MKRYFAPERPMLQKLPVGLVRRRPRRFAEWRELRSFGKLPPWEIEPAGYLMRSVREAAGLTQRELAEQLLCSQQAVAQAERWESNPSIDFLRRWARACDVKLDIGLGAARPRQSEDRQSQGLSDLSSSRSRKRRSASFDTRPRARR